MRTKSRTRIELGEFIVADPDICHGKPTFKGTRIMVWQVLDDVAEGRFWDFICNTRWGDEFRCKQSAKPSVSLALKPSIYPVNLSSFLQRPHSKRGRKM
jgi:hypothetical protein